MTEMDLGAVGGKPINQDMPNEYKDAFTGDWSETEVVFAHTERGRVLIARECY